MKPESIFCASDGTDSAEAIQGLTRLHKPSQGRKNLPKTPAGLRRGGLPDKMTTLMTIVHQPLETPAHALPGIRLPVDRLTLAKRRWRGVAEDGTEFGFDLEKPLSDGAAIFQSEAAVYVLAQKYEPVLEVALGTDSPNAARLGWMIGNLHFAIEVAGAVVRAVDDPAVRQLFEREGIAYAACKRIFHPLSGGHHH